MNRKIKTGIGSLRLSAMKIILVFSLFILTCFSSVTAQIKIYVETDLEGVSGVYKFTQTREKDTPLNIQACEYFMGDLAAVVRGLRDGGATEIIVSDGHGNQAMIPHLMEPGAKYITGKPRTSGDGWRLDESFSGVVMFGYHAMMGTPDGVLNHTQNSKAENRYWYNGVESGEIVQTALQAGYYHVPAILVTGDVATCREATKFLGPEVITVATKQGISREAAVLYPFEETRKALYEGAKKAIAAIPKCKPFYMQTPIKVKLEYLDLDTALPKPKLITKEWIAPDAIHLFGQ
ncbi:MAG: M55 family metallopeptidase [Bacteroidales bacterium]|nr:M55 family metallopeptidase [Bacteroidales bacterium]